MIGRDLEVAVQMMRSEGHHTVCRYECLDAELLNKMSVTCLQTLRGLGTIDVMLTKLDD